MWDIWRLLLVSCSSWGTKEKEEERKKDICLLEGYVSQKSLVQVLDRCESASGGKVSNHTARSSRTGTCSRQVQLFSAARVRPKSPELKWNHKKLQQEVWKETRKSSTAVWRSHLYFFVCSYVGGELQVPESDWFSVFFFFAQSRMTGRLMKLSPTTAAINDRLLQQRWMWQQSLSAVCHSAFAVSTNSWHVQKIWQSQ